VVTKLIAGPGVYICDECVSLCVEICDEFLGPGNWGWEDFGRRYKVERVKRFAAILAAGERPGRAG
jgi:ATP-dependent protease Clp ATPase subunit